MQKVYDRAKKIKILFAVLKYAGLLVLFYLLCIARVGGNIAPFFFGFFIALSLVKNNIFFSVPFVLAGFLSEPGIDGAVIIYAVLALITVAACFINRRWGRRAMWYLLPIYAIVGNIPYIYFNAGGLTSCIISLVLGIVFLYACTFFLISFYKRGKTLKLTIDEGVGGAVLLLAVFCGLMSLTYINFNIALLLGVFAVLIMAYSLPPQAAISLSMVIGLGMSLPGSEFGYAALFALMGVFSIAFKTNYKVFSALGVVLTELLFSLYFNAFLGFWLTELIAVFAACAVFMLLPDSLIKRLSFKYFPQDNGYIVKYIINDTKREISKKLSDLAEVFFEMDKVFRGMVKGQLPVEDAKKMLIAEIMQNECDRCSQKLICNKTMGAELTHILADIVNVGFEKGKVTLLDIPQYLTGRCIKVNSLVNTINALLVQYKQYSKVVTNLDSSRVLIAEQLRGLSEILKNLAGEINKELKFDNDKENKIIEELHYKNITVPEVSVYDESAEVCAVNMVVNNKDLQNEQILDTVNKVCKGSLILNAICPTDIGGLSVLGFTTAPTYDVMFGLAQAFKNNNSVGGDSHSLIRISNDKFMLAVCDGMGSGGKAQKTSELAIGLVENFYKAGFAHDTIIASVNKLLNLNREDTFSALDICVLDLKTALADFVKVGAVAGYIKHKDTVTAIESGALPIGILEEITPKTCRTTIETEDTIILVSDGIEGAFKTSEELKNFINNTSTLNPQNLCDIILSKAKELDRGIPNDDMTVLAARIFVRNRE